MCLAPVVLHEGTIYDHQWSLSIFDCFGKKSDGHNCVIIDRPNSHHEEDLVLPASSLMYRLYTDN